MPQRPPTPQEADWYQSQGIDPSQVMLNIPDEPVSQAATIGRTLKAHVGGDIGGGVGTIAGYTGATALLAPWLAGPEVGLPTDIVELGAGLLGGTIGALAGGGVGQKTQESLQGPEKTALLQQQLAEASAQHPYTSAATDIGASALASGGFPGNPMSVGRGLINALKGGGPDIAAVKALVMQGDTEGANTLAKTLNANNQDKRALIGSAFQAAVNPAISTGISLAQGQGIPSVKELGEQALGGAIFSKSWLPHGRAGLPKLSQEPDEVTNKEGENNEPVDRDKPIESPWTEKTSEGDYNIDDKSIKIEWLKRHRTLISDIDDPVEKAQARTKNNVLQENTDYDAMRNDLHLEHLVSEEPIGDVRDESPEQYEITQDDSNARPQAASPAPPAADVGSRVGPLAVTPSGEGEALNEANLGGLKPASPSEGAASANLHGSEVHITDPNGLVHQILLEGSAEDGTRTGIEKSTGKPVTISPKGEVTYASEKQGAVGIPSNASPGNTQEVAEGVSSGTQKPAIVPSSTEGRLSAEEENELKKMGLNAPPGAEAPEYIPMPPLISSAILQGKTPTTGDILEALGKTEHRFAPLAKALHESADAESLKTPWYHDPRLDTDNFPSGYTGPRRSHYSMSREGRVRVGTQAATDARVVMEEAVHSLTSKKIPLLPGKGRDYQASLVNYLNTGKNKPIKDIIEAYLKVAKHHGLEDVLFGDQGVAGDADTAHSVIQFPKQNATGYALGNLHEFIAQALKDKGFQKVLESIPADDKRNVFQKIVDAVKEMLGLSGKTGSLLDSVLRSSGELVSQDRTEVLKNKVFKKYADIYNKWMGKQSEESKLKWAALERLSRTSSEFEKNLKEQGYFKGEDAKAALDHYNAFNEYQNFSASPEDLKAKYEEASKRMESAEPFSDEFNKAWKDREDIKNQNKGYVPGTEPPEETHSSPPQSPKDIDLPPDHYMGKAGLLTRSVLDKVRDIPDPRAKLVAKNAHLALNKETELKGQWVNPIAKLGGKLSAGEKLQVNAARNADTSNGSVSHISMISSPLARQFYALSRAKYLEAGKQQQAIGEPITQAITRNGKTIYVKRNLKLLDNKWPDMPNQSVVNTYRTNSDRAEISRLDKIFHDYNTKTQGLTEAESKSRIKNYKNSLQGTPRSNNLSMQDQFSARRKAAGTPLPPEFIEQDPVRNMERYFDRAAIDAAHYEFMEKDHKVLSALGQPQDAWGNTVKQDEDGGLAHNPAMNGLLGQWRQGARNPADYNEESLSSLITSAFISGPPLEMHKIISNVVKTMFQSSNPAVLGRAVYHALTNINSAYNRAEANGVVRLTSRNLGQMINGVTTATEKMQILARTIRKVSTLGDITTKVGVGLMQGMNEVIIPSKVLRAQQGDATSIKFLKNLDPNFDPKVPLDSTGISRLASIASNYTHGTGDIRSLPHWMLSDSEFSGFFSLAHWSIAQTNNFMKDVYEPALRGEFEPLIVGALGAAMGGYVIKELREKIQGKRSPIPSLQDIQASSKGLEGNVPLVAYNMISAFQYAGFGGLLSQVAKYPFDTMYKNKPQGATFPLDEVAYDFATTAGQIATAIANDPNLNWVDVAQAATMHVLSSNMQLARIAVNQGINTGLISGMPAEKKELADKMNQLRRFDMVEGLPYNEIDEASNPYLNMEQKKFKLEQDPQAALKELPGLVQNIFTTYSDKPDVMLSKLKALKENAYSTFPSMSEMPLSAMKYMTYLAKEEGPEAAQDEFLGYMKHKIINEAKASAVP